MIRIVGATDSRATAAKAAIFAADLERENAGEQENQQMMRDREHQIGRGVIRHDILWRKERARRNRDSLPRSSFPRLSWPTSKTARLKLT
jgi:hypothetical protein